MSGFEFDPASPFHKGEQTVQHRVRVREQAEKFGRRMIRDYLPDQHRVFYEQLPFVFVGHADDQDWPWASILFGLPGFLYSADCKSLTIKTAPLAGDPLSESLREGLKLGVLGIELPTRRRNRLSASIRSLADRAIRLDIAQSFGNCPQYIHKRRMRWNEAAVSEPAPVQQLDSLGPEQQQLIGRSDTCFVASQALARYGAVNEGADVSHRGGAPGFIRVDDSHTLTIPDYAGNNHFNTLGNIFEQGRAGLLFIDFDTGHVLTMTGKAEILWNSNEVGDFEGAQRIWRFFLHQARYLPNALPMTWEA